MSDQPEKSRRLPSFWPETEKRLCPLSLSREKPMSCRGSLCALWMWTLWDERLYGPGPKAPVGTCGLRQDMGTLIPLTGATRTDPDDDRSPI